MIDAALSAADPVRALWRHLTDPGRIAIALEFMAMAIRRKAVREHMAEHASLVREREMQMFVRVLGDALAREGLARRGSVSSLPELAGRSSWNPSLA